MGSWPLKWGAAWPKRIRGAKDADGTGPRWTGSSTALVSGPGRQPKLASVVRRAGRSARQKTNDALSVAVAALRSRTCRQVAAEDHPAVLKAWSKRHRDLARLRNQVASWLHAVLCDLVPGGTSKESPQLRPPGSSGRPPRPVPSKWPAPSSPLSSSRTCDRLDTKLRDTRKKLAAAVKLRIRTTAPYGGVKLRMDGGRNRACDTPPGLLVPFVAVTIQIRAKLAFRQEG